MQKQRRIFYFTRILRPIFVIGDFLDFIQHFKGASMHKRELPIIFSVHKFRPRFKNAFYHMKNNDCD